MRDLDETDREILRLLLDDARRPYSDIAEHVGLSPPAVSDRIDRLSDLGVIRRFTIDLDRSLLRRGTPVLVSLTVPHGDAERVAAALSGRDAVEHVFRTADGEVIFQGLVEEPSVSTFLDELADDVIVRDVDVELLADHRWSPDLGEATLALACAECDNTVTAEGETARIDGSVYHFCCGSCERNFRDRFETLQGRA